MDKNSNRNTPSETSENAGKESHSAARRRLLKAGAVGIPVIVSLRSTPALARGGWGDHDWNWGDWEKPIDITGSLTCGQKLKIPKKGDVKDELNVSHELWEDIKGDFGAWSPTKYDAGKSGHNLYIKKTRVSCFHSLEVVHGNLPLPNTFAYDNDYKWWEKDDDRNYWWKWWG